LDQAFALAMLTIGILQQNFHDIDDARAILQQIHDFENDFLNEAYPGGHPGEELQEEQDPHPAKVYSKPKSSPRASRRPRYVT
jgi:hypothetical protein